MLKEVKRSKAGENVFKEFVILRYPCPEGPFC